MTRVLRLVGAVLVWSVLGSACLVLLSVFLPLLVVAGLLRALYDGGRWLLDHVRVVDVPDDLDDVLRRRIDGGAADELGCACPVTTATVVGCPRCDWRTCEQHQGGPHLCERDAAVEAFDTNPRNTPVGAHFAAWEIECADLQKFAKRLGGKR